MTCEVVRTYLSAFMDEALREAPMADMREHFESCDPCNDLYLTLRAADRSGSAAQKKRERAASHRESLGERMGETVNNAAE